MNDKKSVWKGGGIPDGVTTFSDVWFLDCYSFVALLGYDFPVATYYDRDLFNITEAANRILSEGQVDAIRIGRTTRGQSPRGLYEQTVEQQLEDERKKK